MTLFAGASGVHGLSDQSYVQVAGLSSNAGVEQVSTAEAHLTITVCGSHFLFFKQKAACFGVLTQVLPLCGNLQAAAQRQSMHVDAARKACSAMHLAVLGLRCIAALGVLASR